MKKEIYKGWTNYETWLFNLWHNNLFIDQAQEAWDNAKDELDYGFTRLENAVIDLAQSIEDYAREFMFEGVPENGFARDLMNAVLTEINFEEIAKNYLTEIEKE